MCPKRERAWWYLRAHRILQAESAQHSQAGDLHVHNFGLCLFVRNVLDADRHGTETLPGHAKLVVTELLQVERGWGSIVVEDVDGPAEGEIKGMW